MVISWYEKVKQFKSGYRVTAAILLRSRETEKASRERLQEEKKQLLEQQQRDQQRIRELEQQVQALEQQRATLEQECDLARQSVNLPEDPCIGPHGYGPRMIALSINLARRVGFRGAEDVLELVFEWFGVQRKLPSRTTIRHWMQRMGLAELNCPIDTNEDWINMLDHSVQIGTEKVLLALGIRASDLPPPGQPLKHEHMRVRFLDVGTSAKKSDMAIVYQKLVDQDGVPRATLTDGAVQLQEPAQDLKKQREDSIVLRELPHYAANVIKQVIGGDEKFKKVYGKLGSTRSAIQQTELAHLVPPSGKPKARYMNLKPIISWMSMIVWVGGNKEAESRKGITPQRFHYKLGWVKKYAPEIAIWNQCIEVVSKSVDYINKEYLHQGAADALEKLLSDCQDYDQSREVASRLVTFVREHEGLLRVQERLPMSTEILESTFGLYKQLEKQHSKSGFTSLLLCLPALLRSATPESVTEAFGRVSNEDVAKWIKANFPSTVNARRQAAMAEYKKATKSATPVPAAA